jgi:ATP phosphoribosyltransferase regulatory subunit
MQRLMERLAQRSDAVAGSSPDARETIVEIVTDNMLQSGLSLVGSRQPEEIADRYIEKQALDASPIPEEQVALLVDYLSVVDTPGKALDTIGRLAQAAHIDIEETLVTVRNHSAALTALSPKADVVFDASFSPRLDYYTGVVFEMTGVHGDVLASGGEYDRLLDRLGATEPVTASGCALWTDRLEAEVTE